MADLDELQWEPLASSHVTSMAWDAKESKLYVQFKGGQIYEYDSDQEEAQGLRNASSPGRFVNFFLRQKGSRVN